MTSESGAPRRVEKLDTGSVNGAATRTISHVNDCRKIVAYDRNDTGMLSLSSIYILVHTGAWRTGDGN